MSDYYPRRLKLFEAEVMDFIDLYCLEYAKKVTVGAIGRDGDIYHVEVTIGTGNGMEWRVPFIQDPVQDPDDNSLAIDIGDAGTLPATGEGLYVYLWHKAIGMLEEIANLPVEDADF